MDLISDVLLRRLPLAVILVDNNCNMQYFNPKAEAVTGIKLDLFQGKSILSTLSLRTSSGKRLDLQQIIGSLIHKTSGPVIEKICRYTHPSDGELWFSVSFVPLEESDSEIQHILMSVQDITLGREIENNLKESEIRYETLFNSVSDGIFLYEPSSFHLIDVNDRIVEMYGYSKKELKTKWIGDLSVKEEGYTNRRGILYALRAIEGQIQIHEWHAQSKSGRAFWIRLLMKRVMIGETPYIMGIVKDIDDQKRFERSLRESEEHYRALTQNSPDIIMRFDKQHRHLFVNEAIRSLLPIDPSEFLNKTHREMGIFPADMCEFWETNIDQVFKTGKAVEVEFSIDGTDEKSFIEWRLFPEFNNLDEITTVLGVARNITEKKKSQGELKKSEERLQLALDATSDGMWDWDRTRNEMYLSQKYFTMLGYEPDELKYSIDSILDLMHPEDQERIIEEYHQQKIIKGDILEVELRMRRKDGSYSWILGRGKVFETDSRGLPSRIVGTNVDVSHRKRQEEIRNILISISDAINSTGNLVEFFESIRFFLGKLIDTKNCYIALYDKETHTISLPFHRDERDEFPEFPAGKTLTAYVISTGQTQLLDSERINGLVTSGDIEIIGTPAVSWLGIPLRIEKELIGVFVVQSYDRSVVYNEEDEQILEFVSDQIALAISRKKDQDKIRDSQSRQLQIFESLPDGLLVLTRQGVIIDHNSRLKEMLNCRNKEIKKSRFQEFVHLSDQEKVNAIFEKAVDPGLRIQEEIQMVRHDQSGFFAEISVGFIQKDIGHPETFVMILKDIDERKAFEINLKIAKEKAEESDRLKTAFLSNMSHEIRTPMNAIIGFAELLSGGDITEEEKQEFISQINYGAESLMRLIDDIIDISKIEAGQIKIYNAFFDLAAILKDLKLMFARNLERQGKQHISLIEDNNGFNTSVQIYGDQIRIRQILNNLLSNAIKFTENGEIRFGISKIEDGKLYFYVKDTGIGIAHEKLDIIFDRFRQGHESKMKFYGGTGLGLAISKHLVEMMGGIISVHSEKGVGSEFNFSVPYVSLEEKGDGTVNLFEKINLDWKNRTILIVEDEVSNFILLREILKPTGIRLLWARDGHESVELYNANPFIDLILMDVQLPNLSGYDATRVIKQKNPEIPVIAQTAYAMSGEKQESIQAGCDDYISKPIKIHDLFILISKYLPG